MQPMRYSLIGKWVHCPLREEFWSRLQQNLPRNIRSCPYLRRQTEIYPTRASSHYPPRVHFCILKGLIVPTVHFWRPVHHFKRSATV